MLAVVVFFFKQKTAYEMRISDWSSDVCSSDLAGDDRRARAAARALAAAPAARRAGRGADGRLRLRRAVAATHHRLCDQLRRTAAGHGDGGADPGARKSVV